LDEAGKPSIRRRFVAAVSTGTENASLHLCEANTLKQEEDELLEGSVCNLTLAEGPALIPQVADRVDALRLADFSFIQTEKLLGRSMMYKGAFLFAEQRSKSCNSSRCPNQKSSCPSARELTARPAQVFAMGEEAFFACGSRVLSLYSPERRPPDERRQGTAEPGDKHAAVGGGRAGASRECHPHALGGLGGAGACHRRAGPEGRGKNVRMGSEGSEVRRQEAAGRSSA